MEFLGFFFYHIKRNYQMKVYSKTVVTDDLENFMKTSTTPSLLREYAEAKGWDVNLFREFMNKMSDYSYAPSNHIVGTNNISTNGIKSTVPSNELASKRPGPQQHGNRNLTQFSLSDEDVTKFATFITYYNNLNRAFDYDNDVTGQQRNSPEVFDIYWQYGEKTIAEDRYHTPRTRNFPYLMEMAQGHNRAYPIQFVTVPTRYNNEHYYVEVDTRSNIVMNPQTVDGNHITDQFNQLESIGPRQKYRFWKLIPVAEEQPFFMYIPYAPYWRNPVHGSLGRERQYTFSVSDNVI